MTNKKPRKTEIDRTGRKKVFSFCLFAVFFIVFIWSVATGAVSIGWGKVIRLLPEPLISFLQGEELSSVHRSILLQLRIPRVLLAAAVGACLAIAGTTFQALFRNPMADPYVIGVSSGASLGAILAMLWQQNLLFLGFSAVPLLAFIGGLGAIFIVYNFAKVGKNIPVMTLLLAGIAISSFLSAFVSLLTYFAGDKLHGVVFWLMGGLSGASWAQVKIMLPYTLVGFFLIYYFAGELNALLLGEETAIHLGIEVEKVKKIMLIGSSLLVAAAVSTSGVIGFVGLIVPHFIRLVAGPDHRYLLPASAVLGATLLMGADTLARTIIAPEELPVGIITALVGAPLFIYLLKMRKKLRYFNSE